jgi:DUF971 family protein
MTAAPRALSLSPSALVLEWDDGTATLAAATLRAGCRCAPCQAARLRGKADAEDAGIRLVDARPVGHYALQLVFSDGHERGIFPWARLRELARLAIPSGVRTVT